MRDQYQPEPQRPDRDAPLEACDPENYRGDPDTFFPHDSGWNGTYARKHALSVCRRCPIATAQGCFVGAIERKELFGIWGGVDFKYGRDSLRARTGSRVGWEAEARRLRRLFTLGYQQ